MQRVNNMFIVTFLCQCDVKIVRVVFACEMSQHGCPERLSNRSKGFQEEGSNQPTMEVLVETLTGTAFEMTVSPSDTIFAIKSKIFRVEGKPICYQFWLHNTGWKMRHWQQRRKLAIETRANMRSVYFTKDLFCLNFVLSFSACNLMFILVFIKYKTLSSCTYKTISSYWSVYI